MPYPVNREQLADYVEGAFGVTWATRRQLLRTAFDHNAPHEVIEELVFLPERYCRSLDELCEHLPHLAASARTTTGESSVATISSCPSCGESERLRGHRADEEAIEVICESCGARWMRGAPRCSRCGGAEVVTRPQVMTRQPRGNQLAIVGRRDLPLCPACDGDAVAESTAGNRPVPEGYVSAFLFGGQEEVVAERHRTSGADASTSIDRSPSSRPAILSPAEADDVGPPESRRERAPARPSPASPASPATPPTPTPPTVRQAIEAFLSIRPGADSLTMLLLGQHLGASTRLDELDKAQDAESLHEWFRATWGELPAARRDSVAATLAAAVAHWRSQGWLTGDPTQGLQ